MTRPTPIPRDPARDDSLAFLREGYTFLGRRHRRFGSDAFEMRLMLQPFVSITGPDAARLFYDPACFERAGVLPEPVRATLLGNGTVQQVDGARHARRKNMFLSLMAPASIAALCDAFESAWVDVLPSWRGRPVTLMPEVERLLTVAICGWVGVPIRTDEVSSRTGTLAALVDGAGNDPIAHVRARLARRRAERWLAEQIADYRRGRASDPTPFGRIATFEDVDGQMLPASVAASEVLNLLRPTVAIGRYITFAAMALHRHPGWRDRLTTSDGDGAVTAFVHEVRRFYPFFPAAAARTRVPVRWQGYELPAGRKVLLDLYGTNRDERSWEQPSRFRPERFFDWRGDPFTFVPQGGGDHRENHRCAGEWITIEVMRRAIEVLVGRIRYDVPDQDLSVSLRRIPTAPRSGFVIENVEVLAG